MDYYCPDHKYNPPEGCGFAFCPHCEFPDEMEDEKPADEQPETEPTLETSDGR